MNRSLEVAIEAAKKAGEAVARYYQDESYSVRMKSGDKGPLTEADLESDRILQDILRSAFPDDAILSEERKDDASRLQNRRCWVIDPLDGTREFTLGIPEFAVSVGLAVEGKPYCGAVFNPGTGELITGLVGEGCWYNGDNAAVTDHDAIDGARFLVSRSEYEKGWFDAIKDQAQLRPCGSVAYKFALVAAGKAEGTFTPKPRNEWDLLGGDACLRAAGGLGTNGAGTPYTYNRPDPLHIGVVGTNGTALHQAVLALISGR